MSGIVTGHLCQGSATQNPAGTQFQSHFQVPLGCFPTLFYFYGLIIFYILGGVMIYF